MALSDNVIRAAREHIRRNDNPGEVENAKRLLDKHQLPYVEASGKKEGPRQPFSFESAFNFNDSSDSLYETLRKMKEKIEKNEAQKRQGTGSSKQQKSGSWNEKSGFWEQKSPLNEDWIPNDFYNPKAKQQPPEHESKDYFFGCDTAAEAIIAGRIFAHYNNGSAKTVDWDQKTKRFYMNNTTSLIANRTQEAFITYRKGFKEAMIDNLDKLIKRNL